MQATKIFYCSRFHLSKVLFKDVLQNFFYCVDCISFSHYMALFCVYYITFWTRPQYKKATFLLLPITFQKSVHPFKKSEKSAHLCMDFLS